MKVPNSFFKFWNLAYLKAGARLGIVAVNGTQDLGTLLEVGFGKYNKSGLDQLSLERASGRAFPPHTFRYIYSYSDIKPAC